MVRKETELDDILRRGLVDDEAQGTRWCGWRLPETRKTVGIGESLHPPHLGGRHARRHARRLSIGTDPMGTAESHAWRADLLTEIETYSDIIARPSISSPQDDKLDPDKLKLDPRFFPPSLWDAYFAPEKEVKRVQAKAGRGYHTCCSLSALSLCTRKQADPSEAKKRKRILDSDDEKDVDEAEVSCPLSDIDRLGEIIPDQGHRKARQRGRRKKMRTTRMSRIIKTTTQTTLTMGKGTTMKEERMVRLDRIG